MSLEELRRELEQLLAGVPHIEYAEIVSPVEADIRVEWSKPFSKPPVVLAMTRGYRYGSSPLPSIPFLEMPRLSLPRVSLPRFPGLPEWRRQDYRPVAGDKLREAFINSAGDWGALNWLRDRFADIFYYIGYAVGYILNWLWDVFIKPYADKWNKEITEFNNRLSYTVEEIQGRINKTLEDVVNTGNKMVEDIERNINTAMFSYAVEMDKWIRSELLKLVVYGASPAPVIEVTTRYCTVHVPADTPVYIIAVGF